MVYGKKLQLAQRPLTRIQEARRNYQGRENARLQREQNQMQMRARNTACNNYHFFSDEEGMAPFKQRHKYLDTVFEFSDEGIVTGVRRNGDKLVFLGDFMDHGPHELKIVSSMIAIHDDGKAVLIAGNRDINKIRMGLELQIVENEEGGGGGGVKPVDLSDVATLDDLWGKSEEMFQEPRKYHYHRIATNPEYMAESLNKKDYAFGDISDDPVTMMYTQTMGVK